MTMSNYIPKIHLKNREKQYIIINNESYEISNINGIVKMEKKKISKIKTFYNIPNINFIKKIKRHIHTYPFENLIKLYN